MIMLAFGSYFTLGTNTILDLSNKLMQAPLGIFGQSLAIAVFPVLTQFYAQQRMDLFKNQLDRTLRTVLYLTIPTSVLLAILAPQISSGLYLSDKVTAAQTQQIAICLQIFCVGIWAWCLHPVLMRAFYSIQDTKTPIIIGTGTTVVFVGLLLTLMRTPLDYKALPLAGSIAPILMVVVMCAVVAKKLDGFDYTAMISTFGKSLAGSIGVAIVSGAVAWTPLSNRMWGHKFVTLGVTAITFCAAMWAYYYITKWLQMPETEYMDRVMKRFDRSKSKVA